MDVKIDCSERNGTCSVNAIVDHSLTDHLNEFEVEVYVSKFVFQLNVSAYAVRNVLFDQCYVKLFENLSNFGKIEQFVQRQIFCSDYSHAQLL